LNSKEAVICEHHFNPKDLIEGLGFNKFLAENAVPEYFPRDQNEESQFCRFCLRNIQGIEMEVDELLLEHYKNLTQEELSADYSQLISCESCYNTIRNSSHYKNKLLENQRQLPELLQMKHPPEYLDIKLEIPEDLNQEMDDSYNLETESEVADADVPESSKKLVKPKRKKKVIRKYCDICKEDFTNITRHRMRKHQDFHLLCDYCGESFVSKVCLQKHMKVI
jgi:hypothetical protein